jgi:3D (Asp-Asp-Asp) domain-containing protein
MKRVIIISVLAFSAQACFALNMSPRIPAANATAPARLTKVSPAVTSAPAKSSNAKSLLARVTVYWASGGKGSDRYTRRHKTATGCRLQSGHCAVDPRHIPYGSQVVLADGTKLAAVDTGSAVRNRKAARKSGHTLQERNAIVIDRFFETKRQALTWAKTHPLFMPVRVLAPPAKKYVLASNRQSPSAGLNKIRE